MAYSAKHSQIYSSITEKLDRIQKKFSVDINWEDPKNINSDINPDKILIVENKWIEANDITEGGKIMGIEKYVKDKNPESTSVIYYSPKGSIAEYHTHEYEELSVILSGKVKFIIDDEEFVLTPIQDIRIKPNKRHMVEFLEDSEIIVTWSKKREIK